MISQIFIIAFLVYAIWYTYQEGEIFGFVQKWDIPDKLASPLFDCNVCMTPWYGSVIFWFIFIMDDRTVSAEAIVEWLITVISAMGVNGIVNRLAPDKG